MKTVKLVFLAFTLLIVSCSSDDDDVKEPYNFTGDWNLSSLTIFNTSPDYLESANFIEEVQADENCLMDSNLSIYEDNTAVLTLTSTVNASMEIVDGTVNELEQIISCENIEEIKLFTWTLSENIQTVSIGSTTADSTVLERIQFYDSIGDLIFVGTIHNGGILYLAPPGVINPIYTEIEGEVIEFFNGKYMYLNR